MLKSLENRPFSRLFRLKGFLKPFLGAQFDAVNQNDGDFKAHFFLQFIMKTQQMLVCFFIEQANNQRSIAVFVGVEQDF